MQSWPIAYWPDGSAEVDRARRGSGRRARQAHARRRARPPPPRRRSPSTEQRRHHRRLDRRHHREDRQVRLHAGQVRHTRLDRDRQGRTARPASASPRSRTATRARAKYERFESAISKVEVEQDGPVRAVVRIDGKHRKGSRSWLPFSVRLYFYAGADSFRMVHTITFDGTQEPGKASGDFIRGLGVRFTVPMRDAAYDRHIRIGGEGTGLLREAVKGITGLRRDPGADRPGRPVRGQEAARPVDLGPARHHPPPVHPRVGRLHPLPALRRRLHPPQAHQEGPRLDRRGRRPAGLRLRLRRRGERRTLLRAAGLLGEVPRPARHPRRPDRRGRGHPLALVARGAAHGPALLPRRHGPGHVRRTARRPQHHLRGLRTRLRHPLRHRPHQRTPLLGQRVDPERRDDSPSRSRPSARLPQLAAPPKQLIKARASSAGCSPSPTAPPPPRRRSRTTSTSSSPTTRTRWSMRRWYGFWDYGDIMHTYDTDRHQWRYDVGGYAWDNSELSPDLWLWFAYLRSGRADIFRFAEAMTRHTGEVDVYHLGKWAGLGTRHGVQHYADSAKQQRIANTTYRRYYYFLTADERVGDLMHANVDSDETFLVLDPHPQDPHRAVHTRTGTPCRSASAPTGAAWSPPGSPSGSASGPKWEKAKARVLSHDGDHRRPAQRLRPGQRPVRPRHREVRRRRRARRRRLAPLGGLRPERAVRRAHRPRSTCRSSRRRTSTTAATSTPRRPSRRPATAPTSAPCCSSRATRGSTRTPPSSRATRSSPRARGSKFYNSPTGYKESAPWKTEEVTRSRHRWSRAARPTWVSTNDTALYGLAAIENLRAASGDKMP